MTALKRNILTLCIISWCCPGIAQTVLKADVVSVQPNIGRDADGYKSCGLHVSAVSLVDGKDAFAYDFSVNLYPSATGLMKAGRYQVTYSKTKGWNFDDLTPSIPGPESFWLAKRNEPSTLAPEKYVKSENPGFVIGGTSGPLAASMLHGILAGEPMQVQLRYPKERMGQIIAFSAKVGDDDRATTEACIQGLIERMRKDLESK